jgi:CRISPR/Cas system-associated exonuclease Cas4 (RecB family)
MTMEADLRNLFAIELENQIKVREEKDDILRADFAAAGGTEKKELEDVAWWEREGPLMIDRWYAWLEREGIKIASTPDGRPAVELNCVADLGRNVLARSVIDRVCVAADGSFGIVDLKSGASKPDNDLQLAIAKVCYEVKYDCAGAIKWGAYVKLRQHRQYLIDMRRWTIPLVRNILLEGAKLAPVQAFPPNLGYHCKWCPVSKYCAAYGGVLASTADPTHPDYEGPTF